MTTQTPWQVNQSINHPQVALDNAPRNDVAYRLDLRTDWGYLAAGGLSFLTFILLFQPWISATGPTGSVSSTAFGQIDGYNRSGSFLQQNTFHDISNDVAINGRWAILAAFAAFATGGSVALYLRVRSQAFSGAVICSSAALAIFTLMDLLYLNGKVPDIRHLTEPRTNFASGFTGIIQRLNDAGDSYGNYSAGLSMAAVAGCAAALGALLSVAAAGRRRRPSAASPLAAPTPLP